MNRKITFIALLSMLCCFAMAQNRKGEVRLMPGSDSHRLYVAFKTNISQQETGQGIAAAVPGFEKLASEYGIVPQKGIAIPEGKLQELEAAAIRNTGSGKSVAKLRNIYDLSVNNPTNERLMQLALALEKMDEVEYCSLMTNTPIQPPFDIAPVTPLFESQQTYMSAMAVNMEYAWNMGLNGQGMILKDIEYGFNVLHEELNDVNVYVAPGMTISNQVSSDFAEHGTAVFGVMYANKGDYGISGMAFGADELLLFPEYQQSGYNRANAVTQAIANSSEGNIIVYEMQTFGPSDQYCPAEYENVIWDLTKAATDAGIVIVAAAGNGNQNLDSIPYQDYMQRGDSGAIIVGAGTNDSTRQRLSFSTYGSKVNLQGWGQGVFTSGYGDLLQVGGDFNQSYTNFSGTSSATPIVASCVAVLQSYYHALTGEYLTGVQMRDLLVETGKQQSNIWQGYIGPLPDMEAAITEVANMLGTPSVDKASFTVYPNPVLDKLTLTTEGFSGTAVAEVYNSIGQLVAKQAVSGGAMVDFSGFSKGIYIVKVVDGDKTAVKRVVKK